MENEIIFAKLKNRGIITITGADRVTFLQGLVTNDIYLLDNQEAIYSCMLTPQGKFLFDFFITKEGNKHIIDCEGGNRLDDLVNILNMYKLRADVQINAQDDVNVYVTIGNEFGYQDPRHNEMGYRSFSMPNNALLDDFNKWDKVRISLCIPDGSRDLIPKKSTMDEGNMNSLNAISYDKGCYLGQELTARMHYRGLGKKHLQTVNLNDMPEKAELRSSCEDIGLALVRTK